MKYIKDEEGNILIYRNKKKVLKKVRELKRKEDGCLHCCLFEKCTSEYGKSPVCAQLLFGGLIAGDDGMERFFVDA